MMHDEAQNGIVNKVDKTTLDIKVKFIGLIGTKFIIMKNKNSIIFKIFIYLTSP